MKKITARETALKNFQKIPGVGKKIAEYFWDIGLRSFDDVRASKPEILYERMCQHMGYPVDRCMLYVFRCAIYFVSEKEHDPRLLQWWAWKDK